MKQAELSVRTRKAESYIKRIRSERKREYAVQYWRFLRGSGTQPDARKFALSARPKPADREEWPEIPASAAVIALWESELGFVLSRPLDKAEAARWRADAARANKAEAGAVL